MADTANFAIDFFPSSFSTSDPSLMGLQSANEGFLAGFIRHADVDRYYCHSRTREEFDKFQAVARAVGRPGRPAENLSPGDNAGLTRAGALLHPFPGFGPLAWVRRFADCRGYSLLGITHTTATSAVMDSIGNLLVAPVQPWDAVICTSTSVKKTYETVIDHWCHYLGQRLGADRFPLPQMPVIPLGVDTSFLADPVRSQANRAKWQKKLSFDDRDFVALWVGRLNHAAKAHPIPAYMALEKLARQAGRQVIFIQAGWFANTETEKGFRDGAQRYAPSVRHIFLDGRVADVRTEIWHAADVFLSLSDNIQETFGLTPIEAMAAAVPVVGSDWDGYRDTVRDGVDGFLVPTLAPPPGDGGDIAQSFAAGTLNYPTYCGVTSQLVAVDIDATAAALLRLAADRELCRRMGAAGRERAIGVFDWSRVIAQYQELVAGLARLRGTVSTVAPRPADRPAFALRADPFEAFGSYPTAVYTGASRLFPQSDAALVDGLHNHALNAFARGWRGDVAFLNGVVAAVTAQPGVTLDDVVAATAADRPRLGRRAVAWLVKMGVLRAEQPAPG